MSEKRTRRKDRFAMVERTPRLRIIAATIGPGKANLLEHIAEERSISEAARQMKMSYKRAWQLIEALNTTFRRPLVESVAGGTQGGGSRLTPTGKRVLVLYRELCAQSEAAGERELRALHRLLKTKPKPSAAKARR